jgi:hypothetical protein
MSSGYVKSTVRYNIGVSSVSLTLLNTVPLPYIENRQSAVPGTVLDVGSEHRYRKKIPMTLPVYNDSVLLLMCETLKSSGTGAGQYRTFSCRYFFECTVPGVIFFLKLPKGGGWN